MSRQRLPADPGLADRGPRHGGGRLAWRPDDADGLLVLVHMLSNRISRAFFDRLEHYHDLTVAEWRVVLTLATHGNCSAMEITQRWAMEKMAVSRAVQRLEGLGRISRQRDPADRRRYELELTDRGRLLYDAVIPIANARYRDIVGCLDTGELAACRELVIRLIDHVDGLVD